MSVWEDSNGLGKGREINHISLQHCAILTACLTPLYQVHGYSAKWTAPVIDLYESRLFDSCWYFLFDSCRYFSLVLLTHSCFHETAFTHQHMCFCIYIYCMITEYLPPWYNCNGWLGVKHQVTYLLHLTPCLRSPVTIAVSHASPL